MAALRATCGHHTVALLGESGAGKSTLVNALVGDEVTATGAVRRGDAKGRHTTTTRVLHPLSDGGVVIDTPGIRAVGLWTDTDAVDAAFEDLVDLAATCRFADCGHETEPGCAVRDAVVDGTVSEHRLAAWQELSAEAAASEEERASSGPPRKRRLRR
jgi:ribosome biogenesis GTPase